MLLAIVGAAGACDGSDSMDAAAGGGRTASGMASGGERTAGSDATSTSAEPGNQRPGRVVATAIGESSPTRCARKVLVFKDGRSVGSVCAAAVVQRKLTLIDLSSDWVPFMLREEPALGAAGKQPYIDTYRALAQNKLGKGPRWQHARDDQFFELYGIPPTPQVVLARLDDDARHRCHDAIDDTAIGGLRLTLREDMKVALRSRTNYRWLARRLEHQRKRRKLASVAELGKLGKFYRGKLRRLKRLETIVKAITAVQKHLVCDGLLSLKARHYGKYGWKTGDAVGAFQRRIMLIADEALGRITRDAFQVDSREHDFRAMLRVLRERVVDAAGLMEDGSAQEKWGKVLGRELDAPAFRVLTGKKLPAYGAPDLISTFTEAAARQLGWTSPAAVRAFFREHAPNGGASLQVAVALPELPAYHGPHMDLRAVVDRGDVSYDPPRYYWGGCYNKEAKRHPTVTLYVRHEGKDIALARWHTTIGGWNKERLPGGWIGLKYKNSEVGRRLWRDVVVSPAWFPLRSTPDSDLVRRDQRGIRLKYDTFGPSYRSAYGLVMIIHHEEVRRRGGRIVLEDNGLRTHGSANFKSIVRGCSHGCHRLYNHQAVRLASFLLRHRRHVRRGPITEGYERKVVYGGKRMKLKLRDRGYKYELTPPVVVQVTKGRIRGRQRTPIRYTVPIRRAPKKPKKPKK